MDFPGVSAGKEPACNVGDLCSIPGLGRSPGGEHGSPLQYSGLENSIDCRVHGVAKSQTEQLTLSNNIHGIPLDVLVLIFLNILHFYVQTFPLWLISNLPAQFQMTSQVANNLIVSFHELGRQARGGRDHGRNSFLKNSSF